MSTAEDSPRPGLDGWMERTSVAGGRKTRWLERTIDGNTGHVEQFYGDYG
jgi:hypothetical protein